MVMNVFAAVSSPDNVSGRNRTLRRGIGFDLTQMTPFGIQNPRSASAPIRKML
jgi:hypothetical protein